MNTTLIVIQHPNTGEEKTVKAGEPYKAPWKPVRSIAVPQKFEEKDPNLIKLGDLTAKLLKSTGFTKWWNSKNSETECKKCQERQAILNYLEFKGPEWLDKWVQDVKLGEDE